MIAAVSIASGVVLASKTIEIDLTSLSYRGILELKCGTRLERLEVISFSPTTKVLWFDWQRNWWGGLNMVEIDANGRPLYWYDMPDPPTAQSIERIRVVTLSGQNYLEVIDGTHMGNGMLYLYKLHGGVAQLKLRVRVMANLSVHFEPRIAHISYRDLDQDGDDDVVVEAECVEGQIIEASGQKVGTYHREFFFEAGGFHEHREKRIGRMELMED